MKRIKFVLVLCLAVILATVMSMPMIASASSKATKVKYTRTKGSTEQMIVKGLTSSNKLVWKYTSKKYSAVELHKTKCVVRGKKVYIFDSTTLKILSKATGKRLHTTKHLTMAGHVVGFDASGNMYVTGYYDTVLYKISPKGKVLWKTDYQSTGKYWAHKIKASSTKATVTCDASDSDPGAQGPFYAVFSASDGKIIS